MDEREAGQLLAHSRLSGATLPPSTSTGPFVLDVLDVVVASEDEHGRPALRGQAVEQGVRQRMSVDEHNVRPLGSASNQPRN